jgi:Tol biopolymer transport system component
MNGMPDLERALRDHFEAVADRTTAQRQLAAVHAEVARRPQRPTWRASLRHLGPPFAQRSLGADVAANTSFRVLAVLLLAGLVVFGFLLLGGARRHDPLTNGRIVFGRLDGTGDPIVVTVLADGSDLRTIPSADGTPLRGYPSASLDGRIAVTVSSGPTADGLACLVMSVDGSRQRQLHRDRSLTYGCGVWSPDGQTMVTEAWSDVDPRRNGLYRFRTIDGDDLTRLTTAALGHDIPIAFTRDGTAIAFACATADLAAPALTNAVCITDADGGRRRVLTSHTTGEVAVGGFTADGAAVLLSQEGEGTLFRVATATGMEERLVDRAVSDAFLWEPRVSPDGRRILYGRKVGGCVDPASYCVNLFTMGLDGTDARRVTSESYSDWFPDWGSG